MGNLKQYVGTDLIMSILQSLFLLMLSLSSETMQGMTCYAETALPVVDSQTQEQKISEQHYKTLVGCDAAISALEKKLDGNGKLLVDFIYFFDKRISTIEGEMSGLEYNITYVMLQIEEMRLLLRKKYDNQLWETSEGPYKEL